MQETTRGPDYDYSYSSREVERLTESATRNGWNVERDIPWHEPVDLERLLQQDVQSLLARLPEFGKLPREQQRRLRVQEGVYHLSNLLAGEHRAITLTAQVMLQAPQGGMDFTYFGATVLSDERNHALALRRYLETKLGLVYQPHPRIAAVLDALGEEASYEIKMFVAQVALEWTAAALISSLLAKSPEPLLASILRKILADESRHLAFNRWVFKTLSSERRAKLQRRLEDLFFEAIVAVTASFFAVPVWQEFGLSRASCREHAVRELEARGVLRFYKEVLPRQLARCHFESERLLSLLERELVDRLVGEHWSFSPRAVLTTPAPNSI